ncbi:MAG: dihydroorotate dehydrogenase 2 [Candidatus Caldarchaeum sp.]
MLAEYVYAFLRRLPPETGHVLGLRLLSLTPIRVNMDEGGFSVNTCFGRLRNPIGLAAGFDKHGKYVKALQRLGFGYVVAGTVTLMRRKGLPKPRVVRREREEALVNAMGFPNPGLEDFLKNIDKNKPYDVPVLISVADENPQYLLKCYREAQKHADAIEINISSPNTPQLRHYFSPAVFKDVAESLAAEKTKPTYLKIPPHNSPEEKQSIYRVVKTWFENGFTGVTAVNALLVDEPRVSAGRGGLSGKPLFPYMLRVVSDVREMVDSNFEIHALGGVFTGKDVYEALRRGANTVQLYTALVYRGPYTVKKMLEELRYVMAQKGEDSVESIIEQWKTG